MFRKSPPGTPSRIRSVDYVWLAYTLFFFIEPIYRHNLLFWLECIAIVALFIVLYGVFLHSDSPRTRLILTAAMFLMGLASYPLNAGATCFCIYAAALLPFALPVASAPISLGCFSAASLVIYVEAHRLRIAPVSWFPTIFFIFIVGGSNIFFAQKLQADCKLRMKQEEIEALAAVAERERIARDLHDVLGHTLSVIVLKSELAGRLLQRELDNLNPPTNLSLQPETPPKNLSSRPEAEGRSGETPVFGTATNAAPDLTTLQRARTEIADIERTARVALAEVREAIGGYRARGLGAEIEAARQTLFTAGVKLSTEGDLQPTSLTAAEETVLALALREAVTNIVRHAGATECRLRLVRSEGRHRLSVEDNGRHAATREGNGLRGMRERVEALGGQLSLTREAGTHLLIDLPGRAEATT